MTLTVVLVAVLTFVALVIAVFFVHRRDAKLTNAFGATPRYGRHRVLVAIHVPCVTSLQFAFSPEDEKTERLRRRGDLTEIQTGDIGFDRSIFIESDDSRVEAWLRRDAEARALISALVGKKRGVELRKGRLALTSNQDLTTVGGHLPGQADRLRSLAERVPRITGADPVMDPNRARIRVLRGLSYVTLGLGLLGACFGWADLILNPYPEHVTLAPLLIGAALAGGAVATAPYLLALRSMSGSSQVPRLASELFVSMWVPIFGIAVLAVHQVNLKVVVGEEHVEETKVTGVYSKRSRIPSKRGRSTHYYFMLPALGHGRVPAAHYKSTPQLNRSLDQAQRVRVYWRQGPLGPYLLTRPPEPLPASGS